jgi:regulator of protease activity HflC (stomatin/prohibitin superfamily)
MSSKVKFFLATFAIVCFLVSMSTGFLYLLNLHSTIGNLLGFSGLMLTSLSVIWILPKYLRLLIESFESYGEDMKNSVLKSSKKEKIESVTKSFLMMMLLALTSFQLQSCTMVEPGHVGIVVNKMGSDRGVEEYPQETGLVWYNPITSRVFEYPTYVQTVVWTKSVTEGNPVNEEMSFNTRDGMVMTGDVSLSYSIVAPFVPKFYVKFRSDQLSTFTHGFLRNQARDKFAEVASVYSVEEVYGEKKETFLKEVKSRLNKELSQIGVVIEQFGFVGAPRPPENVVAAINMKIAATQKAMQIENELRQSQAEALKVIAKAEGEAKARMAAAHGEAMSAVALAEGEATATMARAEATAKSNELISRSISDKALEWKRLALQEQAISRWNGARPQIEGASSNGIMFQLPAAK